jgi:tetratricopeptide (TPR) repeat protein
VISLLIALAAAQSAPPPTASAGDAARFQSCTALVKSQPENGVASANDWLLKGGGLLARQCLGLGYTALQRWAPAAAAFEQAAREAETKKDARAADFWVQSGNAWLAAGDGAKARSALDAALATTSLTPELRGEVHFDRARAAVQLGDPAAARLDVDQGLKLVPADPFGWYLSSALALREGNAARAKEDIAKALSLAPNDADLLLQAGNVAGAAGDEEAARTFYTQAVGSAPGSPAARAAEAALAANAAPKPPGVAAPAK